jgi:hypothetical protein
MSFSLYQLGGKPKPQNNFYHRGHRGAARYTEETYYFLVSSPLLLLVFSVVIIMSFSLYQLGTAPKLQNTLYHRAHRGAARYTEKSLIQWIGFKITSPLLLLVFSVVIRMFYLFYKSGTNLTTKQFLSPRAPRPVFVGALLASAFNLHMVTLTTFCVSKLHAYVEITLKIITTERTEALRATLRRA